MPVRLKRGAARFRVQRARAAAQAAARVGVDFRAGQRFLPVGAAASLDGRGTATETETETTKMLAL